MLNNKIKRILNILGNVVFVLLIFIFLIAMSPVLPFKNIPKTYVVVSGSMEPRIKTGSVALTMPLKPEEAKVNDIVVFASPTNAKEVILHRIIGIKSEKPLTFQTKGDHNDAPDNWDLMGVGILGKYIISVPYLGNIAAFIKKPLGFALVIILPAFIFIVMQTFSIKDAINEEVEKRLKDKLKKFPDPINKIFTLFLFFSIAISFATMHTAKALFNDTVKIKGLSLSAVDKIETDEDEDDCDDRDEHGDRDEHNDSDEHNDRDEHDDRDGYGGKDGHDDREEHDNDNRPNDKNGHENDSRDDKDKHGDDSKRDENDKNDNKNKNDDSKNSNHGKKDNDNCPPKKHDDHEEHGQNNDNKDEHHDDKNKHSDDNDYVGKKTDEDSNHTSETPESVVEPVKEETQTTDKKAEESTEVPVIKVEEIVVPDVITEKTSVTESTTSAN